MADSAIEPASTSKSFSGDVDTTHTAETEVDGDGNRFITGLTGKKILIRPEWKNESNIWNLGILDMKKIFPCQVSQTGIPIRPQEGFSLEIPDKVML